jgi:hypothetical protein
LIPTFISVEFSKKSFLFWMINLGQADKNNLSTKIFLMIPGSKDKRHKAKQQTGFNYGELIRINYFN